MVERVPRFVRFMPPTAVIDKHIWLETDLHQCRQKQGVQALIISGGEADVCAGYCARSG